MQANINNTINMNNEKSAAHQTQNLNVTPHSILPCIFETSPPPSLPQQQATTSVSTTQSSQFQLLNRQHQILLSEDGDYVTNRHDQGLDVEERYDNGEEDDAGDGECANTLQNCTTLPASIAFPLAGTAVVGSVDAINSGNGGDGDAIISSGSAGMLCCDNEVVLNEEGQEMSVPPPANLPSQTMFTSPTLLSPITAATTATLIYPVTQSHLTNADAIAVTQLPSQPLPLSVMCVPQHPHQQRTVWKYFVQICRGLHHMHSKRIMHRDIKPANVFITANAQVKLGDLGLGRYFSSQTDNAHSLVGTPYYMSPERIKEEDYNFTSDIWSLGCILYEMAALQSPFYSLKMNLITLCQKIAQCDYLPLPDTHFSFEMRQLIAQVLVANPNNRPDVNHVFSVAQLMDSRWQQQQMQHANSTQQQQQPNGASFAAPAASGVLTNQQQPQLQQQQQPPTNRNSASSGYSSTSSRAGSGTSSSSTS